VAINEAATMALAFARRVAAINPQQEGPVLPLLYNLIREAQQISNHEYTHAPVYSQLTDEQLILMRKAVVLDRASALKRPYHASTVAFCDSRIASIDAEVARRPALMARLTAMR
jgi:hypothetical protein